MALRLASYNIRAGRGMDNAPALDRQAAVIRALAPDALAVQEVDRRTRRSGGVDQVAALAEATGLHAVFASSMDYDGGLYGIAVLSRRAPLSTRELHFASRHDEPRTLLLADLGDFLFACTHLSLNGRDRTAAVRRILDEILPSPKPLFLAGDWNARPRSRAVRDLGSGFRLLSSPRLPTHPADIPRKCIDYIAVDAAHAPQFAVAEATVVDEPSASDHRPVLVCV